MFKDGQENNLHNPELNDVGYTKLTGDKRESTTAVEAFEREYVISFQEVLRVIRRRLWLIVLVTAMLIGLVGGWSLAQTPIYQASITMLVGQQPGTYTQNPVPVGDLQNLTQTMAETADSRPVAEAAIQQLDLQMAPSSLLENLSAERVPDSQVIRINYTDPSPERAQQIVNAVGDVFSEQVSETSANANPISATVWERAEVPSAPVSPNVGRNTLVSLMAGLLLGTGLAFVLEYFNNTWRSPEELERVSGLPVFGVIPELEVSKGERMGA
jgi:capsular polysaccharide biosynthesis protein